MKTIIKIHDKKWFKEHCEAYIGTSEFNSLKPKYDSWRFIRTIPWLGAAYMGHLEGKILKVERDSGNTSGWMNNARYMAEGFWIPNWAIEWVKEVTE
jgi:hypothetical protein